MESSRGGVGKKRKTAAEKRHEKKRRAIEESLLLQLQASQTDTDHVVDLIQDYMALWDTKTDLIKDIKERGVVYEDVSSVGIKMQKNNPSVKELVMVNRQMLSILKEMKIISGDVYYDDDPL